MVVSHHFLAGAVSGCTAALVLQPLDLIKTRVQQGDTSVKSSSKPSTVWTISRQIVKSDGWIGLWRGTLPTLARNVPGVAIYMTSLQHVRSSLSKLPSFQTTPQTSTLSTLPKISPSGNLIAGAVTRVAVGFALNPLAIIKARFESDMHTYSSMSQAFKSMYRAGPSTLFRGFAASALRDAPYAGLFLVIYERVKETSAMAFHPTSGVSSAVIHSAAGATAGTIATVLTHPFDSIKTRMQVRREAQYRSFVRTVHLMWKERGFVGFFDGVSLRLSKKVLSSALSWTVYEGVLILIRSATSKPEID